MTINPIININNNKFRKFLSGISIGVPVISDCNFRNPVMLPEKVTDPIKTLIKILMDTMLNSRELLTFIISEKAISDDASPPSPLKIATICGIDVICTFLANTRPIIPPKEMPEIIKIIEFKSYLTYVRVVIIAITIPEKEIRLPLLAVTGLLHIFIPNIKNTDDKKYKITYEQPISYHPFF